MQHHLRYNIGNFFKARQYRTNKIQSLFSYIVDLTTKAINALDEVGSRVHITNINVPTQKVIIEKINIKRFKRIKFIWILDPGHGGINPDTGKYYKVIKEQDVVTVL